MKRYKHKLICALMLLSILLGGCNDYLSIKPTNVLSISSYDDIRSLMGAHLKMYDDASNGSVFLRGTNLFYYTNIDYLITCFYADDLEVERYLDIPWGRNNRGDFHGSLNWMHTSIHETLWSSNFTNIGFYNMILHELSNFPSKDESANNQVKAEAKFLRAWSFFRLMQYFSPYHENKFGLPFNSDADKVGSYDMSRKTQTECYAFITDELEEILAYKTKPSSTYNIFFDDRMIHALLAQVYLYKGDSGGKSEDDYQKAIQHAKEAMDGRLSLQAIKRVPAADETYGMHKDKDYSLLTFLYSDNVRGQSIYGISAYGHFQYASDELYDLFQDTDKRKDLYFGSDKRILKYDSNFPYQYYQWDFFTAPELQLIIAESYARMNEESQAIDALNYFASHRYTSYTRPAGETVLQSILNERRKEFCFDYCMRWFDLTRIQKGWERTAVDNPELGTYKLEDGDFRFCMPIPQVAELQNNKIEQNPGWGNF